MAKTGQKPGTGAYFCNNCGKVIRIDDTAEPLPVCPKCKGKEFTP